MHFILFYVHALEVEINLWNNNLCIIAHKATTHKHNNILLFISAMKSEDVH